MEKIVWITRIISKNFMTDFVAHAKNILGGRLKSYENMLNNSLTEVVDEFYSTYPQAKQVRIEFTEFTQGALAIIVHGVLNVE